MSASGIVRNTVLRDGELREKSQEYWVREGMIMREMMEEREVVEGVRAALDGRIDLSRVEKDAETYAGNVIGNVRLEE